MSLLYQTTEEWNAFTGSLVDMNAKLRADRRENERMIRELTVERDALLVERNELAEQAADLGAALEAAKKRIVEMTADLDQANVTNAALVRRNVEKAQAAKQEVAS